MIPLSKEKKPVGIENQLEKLYEMKTLLMCSKSQITMEYAVAQINNQIKLLEEKLKDKDLELTIPKEDTVFDTEAYVKKAKGEK